MRRMFLLLGLIACGDDGAPADEACVVGGCSSELCLPVADADMPGTCAAECSDECLDFATCEEASDGTCGWSVDDQPAYDACMAACEVTG